MSAHGGLEKAARAAGAAGTTYDRWVGSDEVFEAVSALGRDADAEKLEAAFCEGRREFRAGGGWKSVWTTAPAGYDGFGTEEVVGPVEWKGRQLRRVLVDPAFHDWQTGRYGSGGHGEWDEDPREIEAKLTAKLAREKAEIEAMRARRDAGLAWIRTADRALLDDEFGDALDAELRNRALTWKDRSDEVRRRNAEAAEVARAEKWARCRAAFADGASLVDPGSAGWQGKYGWISGRETKAWREVRVVEHYSASEVEREVRVVDDALAPKVRVVLTRAEFWALAPLVAAEAALMLGEVGDAVRSLLRSLAEGEFAEVSGGGHVMTALLSPTAEAALDRLAEVAACAEVGRDPEGGATASEMAIAATPGFLAFARYGAHLVRA